jgi:hypothetical protein
MEIPMALARPALRSAAILAVLCAAAILATPLAPAAHLQAQAPAPPDTVYELRLGDGTRHIGTVIGTENGRILFRTATGVRLEVDAAFARLRPAAGRLIAGEFWPDDRNPTRLFFAPTARTLAPGQGYAGIFWVVPFVGVGITPDFTLGGGFPPWGGDLRETPGWIAPKLRIHHAERLQAAVGAFLVRVPGEWRGDDCDRFFVEKCPPIPAATYTILYSVGTWGDQDTALHAGLGFALGTDNFRSTPLMVGGEHRLGRRWKLLSENWLIPGEVIALSFGFRRIGERWTWDVGWLALAEHGEDALPFFPTVSFSYAWGR